MGRIPTTDELAAKCARRSYACARRLMPGVARLRYAVASVRYVDELPAVLASAPVVHLLCGLNSDSGSSTVPAAFPGLEALRCDTSTALHAALCACRAIKSPAELAVLRYACKLSSEAHVAVMRQAKSGMHEYQLESLFMHHCYMWGGARHVGYTCSACPWISQLACALTPCSLQSALAVLMLRCCTTATRERPMTRRCATATSLCWTWAPNTPAMAQTSRAASPSEARSPRTRRWCTTRCLRRRMRSSRLCAPGWSGRTCTGWLRRRCLRR
jgi:hypothetical protein